MAQKFIARERFEFANGAVGWRPVGPFDCLGPYAKVENCPIMVGDIEVGRRTAYASGYADSFFSVPANTRWKGKYVGGYFTNDEDGCQFRVLDKYKELVK
jgi:hypothetical protein